ncbi:MAG: class I SAM-dependent methyltransferase [Dermatophilaceae bacterium]
MRSLPPLWDCLRSCSRPASWEGIAEVTAELRMPPDGLLLDLACGRGGYGIEVARRAGARLIGVDFSGVALEQARSSSARLLPAGRSEFQVGTLLATGLPAGAADGAMCVDAVQFAEPPPHLENHEQGLRRTRRATVEVDRQPEHERERWDRDADEASQQSLRRDPHPNWLHRCCCVPPIPLRLLPQMCHRPLPQNGPGREFGRLTGADVSGAGPAPTTTGGFESRHS